MMWQWAEEHGRIHGLAGWEATAKALREKDSPAAVGFEETVRRLRKARPRLVVYADNLETLQDGPRNEDPKALGEDAPERGAACWKALERLTEDGLVLVSTRYRWRGLDPAALVPIEAGMRAADMRRMIETFRVPGADAAAACRGGLPVPWPTGIRARWSISTAWWRTG